MALQPHLWILPDLSAWLPSMTRYYSSDIDYNEYIKSPEWRSRANAAKQRAGYRCRICNRHQTEIPLHAHHRTYERLGHELPDDITVLCEDCHRLYEQHKHLPMLPVPYIPPSHGHGPIRWLEMPQSSSPPPKFGLAALRLFALAANRFATEKALIIGAYSQARVATIDNPLVRMQRERMLRIFVGIAIVIVLALSLMSCERSQKALNEGNQAKAAVMTGFSVFETRF